MKVEDTNFGKSYSDYLKGLSPEEYEAHLQTRRDRKKAKKTKQAIKEAIDADAEEIARKMHILAHQMLDEALDPENEITIASFATIWDRVVGKEQQMDITSGGKTIPSLIITPQMEDSKDD